MGCHEAVSRSVRKKHLEIRTSYCFWSQLALTGTWWRLKKSNLFCFCYGLNCVPRKIHVVKYRPQYLRTLPYLEIGSLLIESVGMQSCCGPLNQCKWDSYKRGKCDQRGMCSKRMPHKGKCRNWSDASVIQTKEYQRLSASYQELEERMEPVLSHSPQKGSTLLTVWFWTSSLQNYEK